MRIGVLTNLRAGRSDARTARVLRELARHPGVLRRETRTNRAVPDAVAEFASEGVELLVLCGGDGTVHHALTAMFAHGEKRWRPLVAPVRCGRTNMIALDVGARRDPVRALRDVLQAAREGRLDGRVVERPLLEVDLGPTDGVRHAMFFGAGVLHRAIRLTHDAFPEGRAQGVFGAALVTGTLLARVIAGDHSGVLDPDKMQIALDRTPVVPEQFVLVMATTLDRLFLRLRPFWGTEPGPVRVSTMAAGAKGLARSLPRVLRGRPPLPGATSGLVSRNVHEAAFRLDCGLTVDGELFEAEPGRVVTLRSRERVRFVRS